MSSFMFVVDYNPEKEKIVEVFGIDADTMGDFMQKVVDRRNKHVENDKLTKIFFDALDEMPEEKKAGIIMTLAVAQIVDHVKKMSSTESVIPIPISKKTMGMIFVELMKKMMEEEEHE